METKVEDLELKQDFIEMLQATEREGIDDLLHYMEYSGFYTAPCSGGNHLCKLGGLLEHSTNVVGYAMKLADALNYQDMDSVVIAAALHDLGKCGDYNKLYYVENYIKDGKPTKKEPDQKWKISEAKPFKRNNSILEMNHAVKSVVLANRFIDLTEDEEYAILHHDGFYERSNYEAMMKPSKLLLIIHYADLWCSRFVEDQDEKEGN